MIAKVKKTQVKTLLVTTSMSVKEIAKVAKCNPSTVYRVRTELQQTKGLTPDARIADLEARLRTLEFQMRKVSVSSPDIADTRMKVGLRESMIRLALASAQSC